MTRDPFQYALHNKELQPAKNCAQLTDGLPDLNHVLADHSDLLEVTVHLVVQLREPVGHPELEHAARGGQLVDVDGA
jgi:hypothetical protein